MKTTTKRKRADRRARTATLGPWVAAWIERFLVHGEGDYFGDPFRLRKWQRRFIDGCYQVDGNEERLYDRALLGLPKGNGKTELAGAIALAELGGPVVCAGWDSKGRPRAKRRKSPDIPIAAASFEQADLLFSAARTMIDEGPLSALFDTYDTEILPKEGPGRLYRVAAVAGTNDGKRPTFFVADELHEWEGKRERVHLVLSNGRAKRRGAWELGISTAGRERDSLLGRLCDLGESGDDPRFLYEWHQAEEPEGEGEELDLDDPEVLERALREANPAAGDFLDERAVAGKYREIPVHEFRRYYLNQWTSVPEQWMTPEAWSAAADPGREVPKGTKIVLGFDGSYTRDSTALVACTIDTPHLFVVGLWERPEGVKEWVVDRDEVEQAILDAVSKWEVMYLPADDTFGRIWGPVLESLAEREIPVVEWPTRSPSRMAPACGQFWGAVNDGSLTHSGDERLTRHIENCRTKTDRFGPRIVKEHRASKKKIDAAVAAVIAYDMVVRGPEDEESVYESRGLRTLTTSDEEETEA